MRNKLEMRLSPKMNGQSPAKVDYFVTEDKDFTDVHTSTQEVQRRLNIMRPIIFLRDVMDMTCPRSSAFEISDSRYILMAFWRTHFSSSRMSRSNQKRFQ